MHTENAAEAYPLHWPMGYERTPEAQRKYSRFKTTFGVARDLCKEEVRRIGGKDLIISSDIPIKQNGDLYANWQSYKLESPGIAIYFMRNNQQVCLCCDTYLKPHENLYALARTIEALRQINRDGVSDFLNRTFTGFKAIAQNIASKENCWEVLGIEATKNMDKIKKAYYEKAQQAHVDKGGDHISMVILNNAKEEAIKYANA